ncbi:MAG: hypothetical protein ACYDCO_25830 [Armatimonadota bacterium]
MKALRFLGSCLVAAVFAIAVHAQAPATPPPPAPTVQAASKGSLVKIDGRLFVGLFTSGDEGAYPNRALDIPDAKLRFTFTPSKDITIVNRFSNSKATQSDFDYFYLDLNNWGGVAPGHLLRLGKQKVDVGEETWTDNPVENILITNSAASVSGYDVGVSFRGPIPVKVHATYAISVLNGTGEVGASTRGLATAGKVGVSPVKNLYLSASLYQSGDLIKADGTVGAPALKVANLKSAPAGAESWERTVWEVDARWNYGPTGVKSTIPSSPDPAPFQVAAAIGRFEDAFAGEGLTDREGQYWYVEGLYNATKKIYLATRFSEVTLDDDATARLADSPVAVNKYRRLSLGAGYHLTPLTDIKLEVTKNTTGGGASEPDLDQIAIGVATKF